MLTLIGYIFSDEIYYLLTAPMRPIIGDDGSYVFDLLEAMSNRFRLGVFGALVVGSPVILYETLAFFLPALKPNERRWFGWTFVAGVFLFLGGVAFCYFLILEPSTQWLVDQSGGTFELLLRAQSAMTFAMWFLAGFGLIQLQGHRQAVQHLAGMLQRAQVQRLTVGVEQRIGAGADPRLDHIDTAFQAEQIQTVQFAGAGAGRQFVQIHGKYLE